MARLRVEYDAINESGQKLGEDEKLYLEVEKALKDLQKRKKEKSISKVEILQTYKAIADKVAFPSEYRHSDTFSYDIWTIYTVAIRFRGRRLLVAKAGALDFEGMTLVSPQEKMGHVSKVYRNGTFRFESFDGSQKQQFYDCEGFKTAI